MFVRKYAEGKSREDTALYCTGGRTKQSMKDETDINLIMAKYKKTGVLAFVNAHKPEYMEVPEIDFQTALNAVKEAQETFDSMPSELRKKFRNDPGEFMDFVHNPENAEEMFELGLAEKPPEAVEPPVEPPVETTPKA